jgi:hypothetical protein
MDEIAMTAAVEATAMEVEYEEGVLLGDDFDLHGGHHHHDASDEGGPAEVADDPSKREGNGLRRTTLDMHSDRVHELPIELLQYLMLAADLPFAGSVAPEPPSVDGLATIAETICIGGQGYPEFDPVDGATAEATNEVVWDTRAEVHELYLHRRTSVRWVTETRQLDQEEALAYVLAHRLGYTILPAEARSIGELARHAALTYKGRPRNAKGSKPNKPPADHQLKDAASNKKAKARAAAAKDEALAAGLDERLADIDTVLATDRRVLGRQVVPLTWPDRSTVIRTVQPTVPKDKLGQLRVAAARAEAAVLPAEAHSTAAKRHVQRAKEALGALQALRLNNATGGFKLDDAEWEIHLEKHRELDAQLEVLQPRLDRLQREWLDTEDAAEDARASAEDARDAVALEERTRAAAASRAELDAQMAALKAEREADARKREEFEEASEARVAASLAALKRAQANEPVLWESPAETHERLHAHAEAACVADERQSGWCPQGLQPGGHVRRQRPRAGRGGEPAGDGDR